jgi:hypothetical protein
LSQCGKKAEAAGLTEADGRRIVEEYRRKRAKQKKNKAGI